MISNESLDRVNCNTTFWKRYSYLRIMRRTGRYREIPKRGIREESMIVNGLRDPKWRISRAESVADPLRMDGSSGDDPTDGRLSLKRIKYATRSVNLICNELPFTYQKTLKRFQCFKFIIFKLFYFSCFLFLIYLFAKCRMFYVDTVKPWYIARSQLKTHLKFNINLITF